MFWCKRKKYFLVLLKVRFIILKFDVLFLRVIVWLDMKDIVFILYWLFCIILFGGFRYFMRIVMFLFVLVWFLGGVIFLNCIICIVFGLVLWNFYWRIVFLLMKYFVFLGFVVKFIVKLFVKEIDKIEMVL